MKVHYVCPYYSWKKYNDLNGYISDNVLRRAYSTARRLIYLVKGWSPGPSFPKRLQGTSSKKHNIEKGEKGIYDYFAEYIWQELASTLFSGGRKFLVPIPPSSKLAGQTFNRRVNCYPALELCEALERLPDSDVVVCDVLWWRSKVDKSYGGTGRQSTLDRLKNLTINGPFVNAVDYIVVDDVLTTGAAMKAVAAYMETVGGIPSDLIQGLTVGRTMSFYGSHMDDYYREHYSGCETLSVQAGELAQQVPNLSTEQQRHDKLHEALMESLRGGK